MILKIICYFTIIALLFLGALFLLTLLLTIVFSTIEWFKRDLITREYRKSYKNRMKQNKKRKV
jgi:hypothetical protein